MHGYACSDNVGLKKNDKKEQRYFVQIGMKAMKGLTFLTLTLPVDLSSSYGMTEALNNNQPKVLPSFIYDFFCIASVGLYWDHY